VLPAAPTFGDPAFTSGTGNANVGVNIVPSGSTATLTLSPNSNFSGTLNLIAQVDYTTTINSQTVNLRNDLPFTLTVLRPPR